MCKRTQARRDTHTLTHTYPHYTQLLCIEHTTGGLERDRPVSLGFLDPSSSEAAAVLLGPDDILARLGHHDDRLRGVALRLRPPVNAAAMGTDGSWRVIGTGGIRAHAPPEDTYCGVEMVELYTWSEEEYENLVRDT